MIVRKEKNYAIIEIILVIGGFCMLVIDFYGKEKPIEKVYNRIYNDIISHFYPDVYLWNQEDNINQWNTFQKRGWKGYRDGGKVCKSTENYCGSYTFDFKDPYITDKKTLRFTSYQASAGLNLLDFVRSVLQADEQILVKMDGLQVLDARAHLLDVLYVVVQDSVIDNLFLKVLRRYFHHLEKIEFYHCQIKQECDFSKITEQMEFHYCQMDSIRSFHDCKAPLELWRTKVSKIVPATLLTPSFRIHCLSHQYSIDLKQLFLMCNFPQLEHFSVSPETTYDAYSFEDQFSYLPDSAPQLETIEIEGKVRTLNFLTRFRHLIHFGIFAIYDDFSLRYPAVTDYRERDRILKRNYEQYEITKILEPFTEDRFVIERLEQERILRLCQFLSTLDYTEEDRKFFEHPQYQSFYSSPTFQKETAEYFKSLSTSEDIPYLYECYYDQFILRKQPNDGEAMMGYQSKYRFFFSHLCQYEPRNFRLAKNNQVDPHQIVLAKNFLYASNGKPIVFVGGKKTRLTKKEALEKMKQVEKKEFHYDEYVKEEAQTFLKNYTDKDMVTAGELEYILGEVCDYSVNSSSFATDSMAGKRVYRAFLQMERKRTRKDQLFNKVDYYCQQLVHLLTDYMS